MIAVISPLQPSDADQVIDFYRALSDDTWFFFHPHPRDPHYLAQWVASLPHRSDLAPFKAVLPHAGRQLMVGTVFFWDWGRKVPWLGIAVRDGYQGRGIGDELMRFAISAAWEHAKGGILLTTHKDNLRAQALYKKHGFEILGVDPRDELIMLLR
jgi:RimJ/RimL family protein N-acetyltransferase